MELWDAYNSTFEKIEDMTLVRDELIPDGIYHLACDIAVKHTDGSYLLMQRDVQKHHGGMWELTAGGSALQGETPYDCAMRELREETGLAAESLEEIGRVVHDRHHALYVEYLCVTDCDKDSIVLQEGETMDYRWVDEDALMRLHSREFVSDRMRKFVTQKDME